MTEFPYCRAMPIETVAAPSTTVLDRLARGHDTPPDDRTLRSSQLDDPQTDDEHDRRDRDRAAHMLLHLDDASRVLELGVDHLAHELGVARADAAVIDESERRYLPGVVAADSPEQRMAIASTALPNQHPVLRAVWMSSGSVSFERVRNNRHLGTLEPVFDGLGTTAMAATAIRHCGVAVGVLCLDETEGPRRFSAGEQARIDRFVKRHLSPILHASLLRQARRHIALSPAENRAVQLLAEGMSYADIARTLGKSTRTVDNQLRSARRKTGTHNAVELVTVWRTRQEVVG